MKLGKIQGVEIYDEGQLKTIWIIQERVGSVSLRKLKRRNFEIADPLVEEGFKIEAIDCELLLSDIYYRVEFGGHDA